jgi:hypothetical protein
MMRLADAARNGQEKAAQLLVALVMGAVSAEVFAYPGPVNVVLNSTDLFAKTLYV